MLVNLYKNPSMPIGIPNPKLRFLTPAPDYPLDWSQEVAGFYYIDSEVGEDDYRDEEYIIVNRMYGTPSNPRFSIPNPIPAGSVVFINGVYATSNNTALYGIQAQGTSDEFIAGVQGPVWVTTAKEKQWVINTRPIGWHGTNFFIDNMHTGQGVKVQLGSANKGTNWSVKNAVIRYCDVQHTISLVGSAEATRVEDVVIYGNEIHDAGDIESSSDNDVNGMQLMVNVGNIHILNNYIHHMQGGGIQTLGKTINTQRIFIGFNYIHHTRQAGIWTKYGRRIVISSNHVHDIITTRDKVLQSRSPSKGIGGQYDPAGIWIINNLVYNCSYGIRFAGFNTYTTDPSYYIIGNIVHTCFPQGDPIKGDLLDPTNGWGVSAINLIGGRDRHVYNNIVMNSTFGIKMPLSTLGLTHIKNNILMSIPYVDNNGIQREGAGIFTGASTIGNNNTIESNYFDDSMSVAISNSRYTNANQLNEAGGVNNIKGPVLFTLDELLEARKTRVISNLNLSALADLGADITDILVDRFKADFPESEEGIIEDMLTRTRVQGDSIDIGAFEQGASFQPKKPAKPTGVVINASAQSIEWDVVDGIYTHSIYKNGSLLVEDISPLAGSYVVNGITDSVDTYTLVATSEVGYTMADTLNSRVVNVSSYATVDDLALADGFFLPRVKERKDGLLSISDLSFEGVLYGLPKNNVKFKTEGGIERTGYVYIDANEAGAISGSVEGSGVVTFIIVDSAKQDSNLEGGLYIDDVKVNMINTGGFNVQRVTVEFSESFTYTIKAYGDADGFLGLAAIIES